MLQTVVQFRNSLHESVSVSGLVDGKVRVLPVFNHCTLFTTLQKGMEHVTKTIRKQERVTVQRSCTVNIYMKLPVLMYC